MLFRFRDGILVGDRSLSESSTFEKDPAAFVKEFYKNEEVPSLVVIFEEHIDSLSEWLESRQCSVVGSFFHSYFEDSRNILLYSCREKSLDESS